MFYDSIQMHQEVNSTNVLDNHNQDACFAKNKEVPIEPPRSSLIRFAGIQLESVPSSSLMRCVEVRRLPATKQQLITKPAEYSGPMLLTHNCSVQMVQLQQTHKAHIMG